MNSNITKQEPVATKEKTSSLSLFEEQLKVISDADSQLKFCIESMEKAISTNESPDFKLFWSVRSKCMDLFKDSHVTHALKGQLWDQFIELTKQASNLRKILDEQSAFEIEQIDHAIHAIEKEFTQLFKVVKERGGVDFGVKSQAFASKLHELGIEQAEVELINTLVAKIDALRKELTSLNVRVGVKNKFFQRLSAIGDQVFPKRKELIKQISKTFKEGVDQFIADHPLNVSKKPSLIQMRQEIQAFQALAKKLSISSSTFSKTRNSLSALWDQIKVVEKELKKERTEKKGVFLENLKEMLQKIQSFNEKFKAGSATEEETKHFLRDMATEMREKELGPEEVQALRIEVTAIKKLIGDKAHEAEKLKSEKLQAAQRLKEERKEKVVEKILQFQEKASTVSGEEIFEEWKMVLQEMQQSDLGEHELNIYGHLHEQSYDKMILIKLKNTSAEYDALDAFLDELYEWRNLVKDQHTNWRKLCGSSGLDFEKAIEYNEQEKIAKDRLDLLDKEIDKLERKVNSLKE